MPAAEAASCGAWLEAPPSGSGWPSWEEAGGTEEAGAWLEAAGAEEAGAEEAGAEEAGAELAWLLEELPLVAPGLLLMSVPGP